MTGAGYIPSVLLVALAEDIADSCRRALSAECRLSNARRRGSIVTVDEGQRPDLVLVEVHPDFKESLTTVRQYQSGPRIERTPLIAITRQGRADWETALLESGADDVVRYPFDEKVFAARAYRLMAFKRNQISATRFVDYRAMIRLLAASFIPALPAELDEKIGLALKTVGEFLEADRAYLFEYDFIKDTVRNSHEWCAPGIEAQIESLQNIPLGAFPEWIEPHRRGASFGIESVRELPVGALRDLLLAQGINSLITVPLISDDTCLGFLGIDFLREHRSAGLEELEMLEWLAQLIVSTHQRLRTEGMLRKLSLAVEQSSEAIIITDTAFNIEYVNDTFEAQTGFLRDEAIGRNPSILASGKTAPEIFEGLRTALKQGKAWKGQFLNKHKLGHEYYVFSIITPLSNSEGRVTHFVAVNEDITEKKRVGLELDRHRFELEELVKTRTDDLRVAKEAAEQASRAKSEFLANMSHELRTPLNSVLGMSEVLQMGDVYGPLNERQNRALAQIRESGEHLLELISEILDLSRIEAGKFTLDLRPVDVTQIARSVLNLMNQTARAKGIELDFEESTNMSGVTIVADEQRVRQVLFNLLGNAIKFTPDGGQVSLHIRLNRADRRVSMSIRDTGEGIPLDIQSRLFQPFTQLDTSTTKKHAGSGLGLSIVKRLMELHGGEVTLQSTPGHGSNFTVFFPWHGDEKQGSFPTMRASSSSH